MGRGVVGGGGAEERLRKTEGREGECEKKD